MTVLFYLTVSVFGQAVQPINGCSRIPDRNRVPVNRVKATTQFYRSDRQLPGSGEVIATPERIRKAADDANIISTQPEGVIRTYTRHGDCYLTQDYATYEVINQIGYLDIVYGYDGKTVYLKEPVSALSETGVWAQGTISSDGTQISIPTGQKLLYVDEKNDYVELNVLNFNEAERKFKVDASVQEILLTVHPDKSITADNTNHERIIGLSFSKDNSWSCQGDYESIYTPFADEQATPPAGLTPKNYLLKGFDAYGGELAQGVTMMQDGQDVYLQGLAGNYLPKAWVKGTISNDQITIPSGQFIGILEVLYPMYLITANLDNAGNHAITDLVFTLDANGKTYRSSQVIILADNKDGTMYYDMFRGLELTKGPDVIFSTEVISQQPEGEVRLFQREGTAFLAEFGTVFSGTQDGDVMEITYAPDGETVYLKNPVSQILIDTWVKGTLKGNSLTVPAFQCIAYEPAKNYGGILSKLVLTNNKDENTGEEYQTYEPDFNCKEFTYTIDPASGKISLNDLNSDQAILGVVMTDNFKWPGFGDYATAYTPFNEKYTRIPAGLTTEEWSVKYNDGENDQTHLVNVAIDGEKIYVSGLQENCKEAAITGTLSNGKATFPSSQYLGMDLNIYLFFAPATYAMVTVEDEYGPYEEMKFTGTTELVMDYDAERRILTAKDQNAYLLHCGNLFSASAQEELVNYYTVALRPEFRRFEEKAARPKDPTVKNYDDSQWENFGYSWIQLYIPQENVEGGFIKPDKLAYQLFIKVNDKVEAYTLYTDEYNQLKEDMDIIPYLFTDGQDIMEGGENIVIWQTGFEDIGVQSINYSGGQELRSNRVWFIAGNEESGIDGQKAEGKTVKEVVYYSLDGVRLKEPASGVSLQTVIYTDGSVQSSKVYSR